MQIYTFSVLYLDTERIEITIQAKNRAKAYEIARKRAIKRKNDLDFIELN